MDPTQLRDIHAVLGNPWWPPAPGWWLLLGALLGLGLLLLRRPGNWRLRLPIPFLTLGDWRWDAGRQLRRLRRPAPGTPLKTRIGEASELLRRVAMARHGRTACAGLSGLAWLDWLTAQDPRGFDWRSQGSLLLRATYAPEPLPESARAELDRLLDALEAWILVRPPRPARSGWRGRLTRLWPARWRRRQSAGTSPPPDRPAAETAPHSLGQPARP